MKINSLICFFVLLMSSCLVSSDKSEGEITDLIDKWHGLAADADSTYFTLMTDSAVFIGTDKTEVWPKNEFMDFALPLFAKGKGWSFKVLNRNIYNKGEVYWFDEQLDTWMGICQASGVVLKENGSWKIGHYQLSVTIDNDLMDEFKALNKVVSK